MPALKRIVFPQGGPLGPIITSLSPLPPGTVGTPYSFTFQATGRNPPFTWLVIAGALPLGLSLASTGVLSGTPTAATVASFTVQVTDVLGLTAPSAFSFTVTGSGTAPGPPSQMIPGVTLSNAQMVTWFPNSSFNTAAPFPTDTNTYNIYRCLGANTPFTDPSRVQVKSAIPPRTRLTGTIPFYFAEDTTCAAATTYTYYVTTVSNTGAEGGPGPAMVITTLAGTATPPTPPAPVPDPATWITTFALPAGTKWTATDFSHPNAIGPVTPNVDCGFQYALSHMNVAGGDYVILTAGATYTSPGPNGFQPQAFTGTSGWTYVISSEAPEIKTGGKLPPYVPYTGPTYPVRYSLTAGPAIGATSATLTSPWLQKTGIYPTQFYNATAGDDRHEQRYVLCTKGSATITWTTHNPCGIDGTPGAGLVFATKAFVAIVYLPGVTLYDLDNGALPLIQAGGAGSSGYVVGFGGTSTNNVRWVGIAAQTTPTDPTDNGAFENFYIYGTNGDNVCWDRCIVGHDTSDFTTSGLPNCTVTSTTFGHVQHGINLGGLNNLVHQCYIQGVSQCRASVAQDSNGILSVVGGPYCIQNSYIEAVSEGVIFGGSYVQVNQPHDYTYRGNFGTKPQWWTVGAQTLSFPFTPSTSTVTGNGTTGPYTIFAFTMTRSTRFYVTINGTVQAPSTYTMHPATPSTNPGTITFTSAVATGATIVVKGQAQYLFGDNIKNIWELKSCIRANVYGNTHWNDWYSNQPGYRGSSFAPGARDQRGAAPWTGPNATSIFMTCPWVVLTDVDIHDNVSWRVGQGVNPFGAVDYAPAPYTARVRVQNNQFWIAGPPPSNVEVIYQGQLFGALPQGLIPDFIFNNNTFVLDTIGASAPGSLRSLYFTNSPAGSTAYDRFQIQNNIFPHTLAVGGDNNFNLNSTNLTNPSGGGWNNNLTIVDATGPFPTGSNTYKAVAYTKVGFVSFVDNLTPPTQPSDWNVSTTTYLGTDGKPVGATFPAPLQFPLVGGYFISGSVQTSLGTPAFQAQVATLDMAMIATYPGWSSGGFNMVSAGAAIKAINPAIKLGVYTNIMELQPGVGPSGSPFSPVYNAANAAGANWFLRNPWPAGPIVDADGNAQSGLNQTTFTNIVSGQNYLQWRAGWSATNEFPTSNWDAVYLDNVFYQPRITADYAQTGSSQTAAAAAQNWRNGYASYVPLLKAQLPAGSQIWGNVADWFNNQLSGYNQLLNGGVMETFIGPAGGTLEASGWTALMNGYKVVMQNITTPGYSIFGHDGVPTNYAAMRYGLCSCLLDNAYYFFNANGNSAAVTTFDEFNFNLGSAIAGPNNLTNGTYSSGGITAWQNGVYRRDFQNGIILVNPRGNGAKTVTLETTYWHLRGTQDPTTNNAAAVTSVTMPDPNTAGLGGSGLFLSRTAT